MRPGDGGLGRTRGWAEHKVAWAHDLTGADARMAGAVEGEDGCRERRMGKERRAANALARLLTLSLTLPPSHPLTWPASSAL